MTLYHFTTKKYARSIRRVGLTLGVLTLPTVTGYDVQTGWIWLTVDGEAARQSWNTRNILKYSRDEVRLTVEIPAEQEHRLLDREALCGIYPEARWLFEGWAGSENWRVFHGVIPKEWITEYREKDLRRAECMTRFDVIRNMTDEELIELLQWRICFSANIELPDCADGCEDCGSGCALNCPHEKQERALREYLSEEI